MADDRIYTIDELDELEETNEHNVTLGHLIAAMEHVIRLLESSGIPYAVMGGMHMIMRGYADRTTSDVDIAVETNARNLLQALSSDQRILRPRTQSVAGSGVARIFVATGPAYGENLSPLAVEVDLILSGHRGAPRHLDERTVVQTEWSGNGTGVSRRYNILSLEEILRAKLSAFHYRESTNDSGDVIWLCLNLAESVSNVSCHLDQEQKDYFLDAISQTESEELVTAVRNALQC